MRSGLSIRRRSVLAAALRVVAILLLTVVGTSGCALTPRTAGPPANALAPPFSLPSHHGSSVSLDQLIRNKPAVVMFYRGYW